MLLQLAPRAPKYQVAATGLNPAVERRGHGDVVRQGQMGSQWRSQCWISLAGSALAVRDSRRDRRRYGKRWRRRLMRSAEDGNEDAKHSEAKDESKDDTQNEASSSEETKEKEAPAKKEEANEEKPEKKQEPKASEEVREEKEEKQEKEEETKKEEVKVEEKEKEDVKEEEKEKEEAKEEDKGKEEVKEEEKEKEEVKEEEKEKEEVKEEEKEKEEVKEEEKEKEEAKEEEKEKEEAKEEEKEKEEAKEEEKEKEEAKEEEKEEKEEVREEEEEEKEEKEEEEKEGKEVKEQEKEEVKEEKEEEEEEKGKKEEVKAEEKEEKEEVKAEKKEEKEEVKEEEEEEREEKEEEEKEEREEEKEEKEEVKAEKKEDKEEVKKEEEEKEEKEEVTAEEKEEKEEEEEEVKKEDKEEEKEEVKEEEKEEKEEKEEVKEEEKEEKEEVKEEANEKEEKSEEADEEKAESKEETSEKDEAKESDDDAEAEAKARKSDLDMPADDASSLVELQATEVAEVLQAQEEAEEKVGAASGISGKELREMKEQVKEMFDWNRAWYPIAPLTYLNADAPNPVKLLGKRMVVWCSNQAKNLWHAALDVCPHRMAPLSLGTVKEGCLKCRYHGWTFNEAGSCVKVPMAQNAKTEARMCSMSRSTLTTFPVQVKQGLVWIFPYMGPDALTASKRSSPCVTPECEGSEWVMTTAPVGYQVSVENTFDPSHAPFVHNGISRYSPDKAISMSKFELRDDEISGKRGFVLEHDGYDEGTEGVMATRQFVPPCSNTTVYKYKNRRNETTQLYFVPCGPHETRYIVNLGDQVNKNMPQIIQDILHVLFFNKIFGYRFQEQDLLLMRGQERSLHESPQWAWGEQYVLGTTSDKGVEVFRKWWYDCANGGPYFPRASRTLPASDPMIFDRWQRHAQHCAQCKRVMKAFGHVQSATGRLSVLGLCVSTLMALLQKPRSCCAWLLTTMVLAALGRWAAAERWGFVSSVPLKGLMEVPVYKS